MKSKQIRDLERALGYEFNKIELITQALTHRSHYHEYGDTAHNERLEFLGDAVLDLCVTELVMKYSPTTSEGHLSKLRSQLVSEVSLAKAARSLNVGPSLRLGRGEEQSGGRDRDALLADSMEAILAAIYLDGGFDAALQVVSSVLNFFLEDAAKWASSNWNLITRDYKSRLQEYCQSLGLGAPSYICVDSGGPDHARNFVMALFISQKEMSRATGLTKKEASQLAAKNLLDKEDSEQSLLQYFISLGVKPQQKTNFKNHFKKQSLGDQL